MSKRMPRARAGETAPLLGRDSAERMSTVVAEASGVGKRSSVSAVLQPWVGYVVVAYTGLALQVAVTDGHFLAAEFSVATVQADGLRVAMFALLWSVLTMALWKAECWPQWFLDKRVGKPGKEAMPATIVVSFIHSCFAVGVGIALLVPTFLHGEWNWHMPMSGHIATYVAMFLGYQISDTVISWRFLGQMHRVHHFAGMLAWGFPLFTRSQCMIVPLAYLLAEGPNPFLHLRWILKHWDANNGCVGTVNEYIFVASWIVARNIPELIVCFLHAWFEELLPYAWRITVLVGNVLTCMWTVEIIKMSIRTLRAKRTDPSETSSSLARTASAASDEAVDESSGSAGPQGTSNV